MITKTLGETVALESELSMLVDLPIAFNIKYRLTKLMNKLTTPRKLHQKEDLKLFEKYGVLKADVWHVDEYLDDKKNKKNPKFKLFHESREKLITQPIDIDFPELKLEDFKDPETGKYPNIGGSYPVFFGMLMDEETEQK